jgi:HAD superfamily hydrolase (TIGR01509 family)
MLNPTALIFDMDGVLIDSEGLHKVAKQRAFAAHGIVLDDAVYESYKGRPDAVIVGDIVRSRAGGDEQVAEVLRLKHRLFEEIEQDMLPVTGVQPFLEWARLHYRLALGTSATPRNRKAALAILGASEFFEVIVDAGEHTEPKPNPEVFLTALRRLGVRASDAWVIEDSLNGVRAAKAAECTAIAITTTFDRASLESAGADRIVTSFEELRTLFADLQAS